MQNSTKTLFGLLLSLACLPSPVTYAESGEPGTFLYLGAGYNDANLEVKDRAQLFSKNRQLIPVGGIFTYPRPFINFPVLRLLRWSLEFGGSSYSTGYQLADRAADAPEHNKHNLGNEANLGTSVSGYMAFVTPSISLYTEITENLHAYLGFGVGAGFVHLNGSYYVTDGPSASDACKTATTVGALQANCQLNGLNANTWGLASSASVGFRYRFIGFRYLRGGPTFSKDGMQFQARSDLGMLFLQIPL